MQADHVFKVIDIHSGGAPCRLVQSGIPKLAGDTTMAQMQHFATEHDWIRRALVLEPRGRGLTSAVVLVPPTRPDADVGAFFMEAHGYLPMCGSDTISTVTALIETGQIAATGEQTVVRLDTPAGLIEATATVSGGRVTGVTFVGAPAYCALPDQTITLPSYGPVRVNVSYGGNFYAIVDADELGVELREDNVDPATAAATEINRIVNQTWDVQHPLLPEVRGVTHVQLFQSPDGPTKPTKDMVIMPKKLVDRSPCGTGTTAKVATLFASGQLALGEGFVHQSFTGASYVGRPVFETTVGEHKACRVAITGSAYLVSDSTIFVDRRDELVDGFQIS